MLGNAARAAIKLNELERRIRKIKQNYLWIRVSVVVFPYSFAPFRRFFPIECVPRRRRHLITYIFNNNNNKNSSNMRMKEKNEFVYIWKNINDI